MFQGLARRVHHAQWATGCLHPGFVSAASPWRVSCRYPRHSSNLKKEEDVFTQALTFMSHTSPCYWGACVSSFSLEIPCLHPSCSTGGEEREVVAVHGSARRCKCYLVLLRFIITFFFCNARSVLVLSAAGCRGRLISVTCNFGVLLLICISLFLMFIPFQISRTICLEG